jgi:hypothetical protein
VALAARAIIPAEELDGNEIVRPSAAQKWYPSGLLRSPAFVEAVCSMKMRNQQAVPRP